jgi:hypothetical protein
MRGRKEKKKRRRKKIRLISGDTDQYAFCDQKHKCQSDTGTQQKM